MAQLKALDIPFEAHILSAHRTPAEPRICQNARVNGFGVILCAAGMAAIWPCVAPHTSRIASAGDGA